jgi:hypothetical protein
MFSNMCRLWAACCPHCFCVFPQFQKPSNLQSFLTCTSSWPHVYRIVSVFLSAISKTVLFTVLSRIPGFTDLFVIRVGFRLFSDCFPHIFNPCFKQATLFPHFPNAASPLLLCNWKFRSYPPFCIASTPQIEHRN